MFRTLLALASVALFTARAEAASSGACSAARTMADVGLVAAGVGTVGAGLMVPGIATDRPGVAQLGAGLTYLGVTGSIASGVAMVPTAARCGRTGRGVVGGTALVMAGLGAPAFALGASMIVVGYAEGEGWLGVLGVPLVGGGAALATTGVLLNRRARMRLAPVQDVVVLPQLGQTPGLVVSGRF